jgi:O-antigen/teichoic acid export membrane protein
MTTGRQPSATQKDVVVKTASGAAIAGAGNLVAGVLRYTATLAMTHMVAPEAYGLFVVTLTAATFLSYLPKVGLDTVLLRFLPAYRAGGSRDLVAGLLRFAVGVPSLLGLLCGLVLFALAPFLASSVYHNATYTLPFMEAAVLVPLLAVEGMLISALRSLKAIKWQVGADMIIDPGVTLLSLGVFYLLGLRLQALILANICGVLAAAIVALLVLSRATDELLRDTTAVFDPGTWLRFGSTMIVGIVAFSWVQSTDVLFLGAFANANQVGLYGVADRVGALIGLPLVALNVIFAPMITELHASGERAQLEKLFALVTRWSLSMSLPVFLCCVIFQEAILGVFGKGYRAAGATLTILAVGNLVNAGSGSVSSILTMTGRMRVIWVNMGLRVAVNLALVFALIPRLTIIGAALAVTVTAVALNAVGVIEVWWIMRVHPFRWAMVKALVAAGAASLVGMLLVRVIPVGSGKVAIVGVLSLVLGFLLVYILVLALVRPCEEDVMVWEAVQQRFARRATS